MPPDTNAEPVCLTQRRGGVLLPIASLPGGHGIGDIGRAARVFIDWLAACELGLWQILPCVPLGLGWSPYSGTSSLAMEPLLLDLHDLADLGLLHHRELPSEPASTLGIAYKDVHSVKEPLLHLAALRLAQTRDRELRDQLESFSQSHCAWLDDTALYFALRRRHRGAPYWEWPSELAERHPRALARVRAELALEIEIQTALQWLADRQSRALKSYAARRGVAIVGDMPLYISLDSVECWATPELFSLAGPGRPLAVGGVPPDSFSPRGQRWGTPCYDWAAHEAEGFAYWTRRIERATVLADVVRLDHFRGLSAAYEIPGSAADATHGQWRATPGEALLRRLRQQLGALPLVAEDLGFIDEPVRSLRDEHGLLGMAILQFAFDGDATNEHLPHNHVSQRIVYTGTHDNDTSVGWWRTLPRSQRAQARSILRCPGRSRQGLAEAMVHAAFASVARWAIAPLADLLAQDSRSRINRPGTEDAGNWTYRAEAKHLTTRLATRTAQLARLLGRSRWR